MALPENGSSDVQIQVAASEEHDFADDFGTPKLAAWVENHDAGTIVYVNRHGATITLEGMGPGVRPIAAQSIHADNGVRLTVYF